MKELKKIGGNLENQDLQYKRIKGKDYACEYYPCHFEGQDCTWCFCPFYPCNVPLTGGRITKSNRTGELVWSCKNCNWVHRRESAQLVLNELSHLASRVKEIPRDKLLQVFWKTFEASKHGKR